MESEAFCVCRAALMLRRSVAQNNARSLGKFFPMHGNYVHLYCTSWDLLLIEAREK